MLEEKPKVYCKKAVREPELFWSYKITPEKNPKCSVWGVLSYITVREGNKPLMQNGEKLGLKKCSVKLLKHTVYIKCQWWELWNCDRAKRPCVDAKTSVSESLHTVKNAWVILLLFESGNSNFWVNG